MEESAQFNMIRDFMSEYGSTNHLITSYNYFIDEGIQKIIDEESTITIRCDNSTVYKYTFGEAVVSHPVVINENRILTRTTPLEARFKNFTYEGTLMVNIHIDTLTEDNIIVDSEVIRRFHLAKIPIMVGSNKCILKTTGGSNVQLGECAYEPSGYFIIRGKERVLISQERANYNTVISIRNEEDDAVHSEIRSISYETGHSAYTECIFANNGSTFVFVLPYINQKVPIGVIFNALGLNDETIVNLLCPKYVTESLTELQKRKWDRIVRMVINDTKFIADPADTVDYLSQFILHSTDHPHEYVRQVLGHELFPHLGCSPTRDDYLWILGHIAVHTMMVYFKFVPSDNKDHLANKRLECAGTLLHDLFRTSFKRFVRSLVPHLQRCQNIQHAIHRVNNNNISKDITYCFLSGNWGLQKNNYVKTGVSQILSRLCYMATNSHLRRINMHIGKEVKNSDLRQIHQSSIFFIDPAETPEGICVGIVKNLALMVIVSNHICSITVRRILETLSASFLVHESSSGVLVHHNETIYPVLLNNTCIGFTATPEPYVKWLRSLRQSKIIHSHVSITYSRSLGLVQCWCDKGRMLRPLIVLPLDKKKLKTCKSFTDMVERDVIRFLDPSELENVVVAMTPAEVTKQHDYLEIHPTCMLGVIGNITPFADHSQAPRVCYYSSMCKQTIGIPVSNMPLRIDTALHTLQYIQKPIVTTQVSQFVNNTVMGSGINCIVAIANYTGLNQEDCVIVNKQAIERGLFVSDTYRTITVDEKRTDSYTSYVTCVPDIQYRKPNHNYHKLDKHGIIRKGIYVETNDVLVGRISKKKSRTKEIFVDASIVVNFKEEGIVDDIFIVTSPDGYRIIKIRIRTLKIPEIGDKVAQVSGQKGTIGLICSQEDMMFTSDGIVPDIIVNSHAIPSRMTISMLLEMVLGKTCCIRGLETGDSTSFSKNSVNVVDELCDRLEECGFERTGYEDMYNGMTGEKFQSQIFIGVSFYHKLKHMVSDKMYARGYGNVQLLTNQPTVGRSKQGALKMGEMETQCTIAQACASMLVDRLYEASDPYSVYICRQCGQMINKLDVCEPCGSIEIVKVKMPYAFKLLTKMLLALNIKTKITPE